MRRLRWIQRTRRAEQYTGGILRRHRTVLSTSMQRSVHSSLFLADFLRDGRQRRGPEDDAAMLCSNFH